MALARIAGMLRLENPAAGKRSAGFSLLEVTIGMIILALVFVSLAKFTKLNRKAMGTSNKAAQGYYVGTTWTEAMKTWYADTLDKYNGKTRFEALFASLGPTGTKDTTDYGYWRGNTEYFTKMTYSRAGDVSDSLIVARGEVKWDSVAGSPSKTHKFTWGIILGKPLKVQ